MRGLCIIVVWQLFSFLAWNMSFNALLTFKVSVENLLLLEWICLCILIWHFFVEALNIHYFFCILKF
jgi:hypothetical protein